MTTSAVVATVGHGSTTLWYLTRSSGLLALILLSTTVVLGIVASVGWTTDRWPRFLSQSLHRNLSLFCLVLVGVHIVATITDGFVPIVLADAVIPFVSPYRPIWVGLGALAFDMLIAVAVTSALRRRIGAGAWRGVHWLAYACWPIAVLHGLGSGTDARVAGGTFVFIVCVGAVVVAAAWRLAVGRARSVLWRLGGALAGAVVVVVIVVFAAVGPLRPGWSHRSGTSPALLAQLSRAFASYTGHTVGQTGASTPTTSASASSGVPSTPFATSVTGTMTTTPQNGGEDSEVTLTMKLQDTKTPLTVRISGPAVDGGVSMRRSAVSFGPLSGQVTALEGSNVGAVVNGPSGSISLTMQLSLNPSAGTLTGRVSGSAAQ